MDSNSGILSENTKANYTKRYDSLLKMKNHVIIYNFPLSFQKPYLLVFFEFAQGSGLKIKLFFHKIMYHYKCHVFTLKTSHAEGGHPSIKDLSTS